MKKFGIRTNGTEIELENLISEYVKNNTNTFKYYEIGCAGCLTLRAISDIVKENIAHSNYTIDGIDLSQDSSLNWQEINSVFSLNTLAIFNNGINNVNYLAGFEPKTRLLLWQNPREYSVSLPNESIDIVLIDGNHNKQNVIADYNSIFYKVKKNGLIIFHDFGPQEQNTDPQAGGGFIEVLDAVRELGLFNSDKVSFVKEIAGSRYSGGDGNSFGVFRKL
jgi:hypothetical protein